LNTFFDTVGVLQEHGSKPKKFPIWELFLFPDIRKMFFSFFFLAQSKKAVYLQRYTGGFDHHAGAAETAQRHFAGLF